MGNSAGLSGEGRASEVEGRGELPGLGEAKEGGFGVELAHEGEDGGAKVGFGILADGEDVGGMAREVGGYEGGGGVSGGDEEVDVGESGGHLDLEG